MIKILFLIESLHCGGAEKSLTTLLHHIDYTKYSVDLMLMVSGGEFQKFVPNEVNLIINNNLLPNASFTKLVYRLKYFFQKKITKKRKYHPAQLYWKTFGKAIPKYSKNYDIAIAYNQGFATYFVASKINATKKIAWLNTDYKKAGYNFNFDAFYYNNFLNVVCVSKENQQSLIESANELNTRLDTLVIKDISDEIIIQQLSEEPIDFDKNEEAFTIVSVGRLAKAKGFSLAIDACSLLIENGHNIKWYIIGEGPERENLEKQIYIKNLQNNFILLGFKENPYPYVKKCDIYVQTSLFEGLGLTVIEAAILKKPIVTTNFPSAFAIIEHEKTGLICEMNSEDIANKISLYINNTSFITSVANQLSQINRNDKNISLQQIKLLLTR